MDMGRVSHWYSLGPSPFLSFHPFSLRRLSRISFWASSGWRQGERGLGERHHPARPAVAPLRGRRNPLPEKSPPQTALSSWVPTQPRQPFAPLPKGSSQDAAHTPPVPPTRHESTQVFKSYLRAQSACRRGNHRGPRRHAGQAHCGAQPQTPDRGHGENGGWSCVLASTGHRPRGRRNRMGDGAALFVSRTPASSLRPARTGREPFGRGSRPSPSLGTAWLADPRWVSRGR